MFKRKTGTKKQGSFPAAALFLAGFLVGVILPNAAWRLQWKQRTLASFYLLGAFGDKSTVGTEYFIEVLRIRGSRFALLALCGFSVFGLPLAVFGMIEQGLLVGMLLTMSILEFGLTGGAVGLGLLFPQYVVYIPVTAILTRLMYAQSLDIWKNHGMFPKKIRYYTVGICICGLFWVCGSILEAYLNPWVLRRLMEILKIF